MPNRIRRVTTAGDERKLIKALHRQASRLLSVLDKVDALVPLSTMERLRLDEVERAILYIKAHRGWLGPPDGRGDSNENA